MTSCLIDMVFSFGARALLQYNLLTVRTFEARRICRSSADGRGYDAGKGRGGHILLPGSSSLYVAMHSIMFFVFKG